MGSFELKTKEHSDIQSQDTTLKDLHATLNRYIGELKNMRVSAEVTLTMRKLQEARWFLEEDFQVRGI